MAICPHGMKEKKCLHCGNVIERLEEIERKLSQQEMLIEASDKNGSRSFRLTVIKGKDFSGKIRWAGHEWEMPEDSGKSITKFLSVSSVKEITYFYSKPFFHTDDGVVRGIEPPEHMGYYGNYALLVDTDEKCIDKGHVQDTHGNQYHWETVNVLYGNRTEEEMVTNIRKIGSIPDNGRPPAFEEHGVQGCITTRTPYAGYLSNENEYVIFEDDILIAATNLSKKVGDKIVDALNAAYRLGWHECSVDLMNKMGAEMIVEKKK